MPLMNSFYGGRQGASFVIVKNYIDVLSMVTDFSQGNDFTEVKFDEYLPDYIYGALNLGTLQQTSYSKYYLCRRYALKEGYKCR